MIGEKIRKLRRELDYSQEYIASELDISQHKYSQIENNKVNIKIHDLLKISKVLKVPPSFFLMDENDTNKIDVKETIKLLVSQLEEHNKIITLLLEKMDKKNK